MEDNFQIKFTDSKQATDRGWNTYINPLIKNKINEFSCSKLSSYNWLKNIPEIENCNEKYVEVRFKNNNKDFFELPSNIEVFPGDIIVVDSNTGHDVGIVTLVDLTAKLQMFKKHISTKDLKKVTRKATQKDVEKWLQAISKEEDALIFTRNAAEKLGLKMKMNDVEYQGDGLKAIFYYTADERVDFRELIRILADHFKIRIEMKQIGVRQEAGHLGGLGPCGRELCCASWMNSFHSVSTNSAKIQQLSSNPQKLAGQCSKLKCCLNYEVEAYADALNDFPNPKTIIRTKEGDAEIQKIDVFAQILWLAYQSNFHELYPLKLEDVNKIIQINKQNQLIDSLKNWKIYDEKTEEEKDIKLIKLDEDIERFDFKKKKKKRKQKNNNNNNNNSNNN